jgi:ribosomal protein S18 acetylase RimI-like enzyme
MRCFILLASSNSTLAFYSMTLLCLIGNGSEPVYTYRDVENSGALKIRLARPDQLDQYLEFLEELATWLESRGIAQWQPGNFRKSRAYYGASIAKGETWVAYCGPELVGTIRVLDSEPAVWPEIEKEDGVYVYNLAVNRRWAGCGIGTKLLAWADECAVKKTRKYVRLDCAANNGFLKDYYQQSGFDSRGEVVVRYPEPIGIMQLHRFERRVGKDSSP